MVNFDTLPPAVQEALKRPSSRPPPGMVSNLDNPPNGNAGALALAIICIILVATSVSLRLYSRLVIVKRMRIEDCRSLHLSNLLITYLTHCRPWLTRTCPFLQPFPPVTALNLRVAVTLHWNRVGLFRLCQESGLLRTPVGLARTSYHRCCHCA